MDKKAEEQFCVRPSPRAVNALLDSCTGFGFGLAFYNSIIYNLYFLICGVF